MAEVSTRVDIHGWIVLDKPQGITSTRALARVKRVLGAKKAGHAGTLDPLASGVLAIALGEATKTVSFIMDSKKTYRFTVAWGVQTDTDDTEGETIATSNRIPTADEIRDVLPHFTGPIMQRPPVFSALKVDGKRAYDLARQGKPVSLSPRAVEITSLDLIETPRRDRAVFETRCGKGTYIRALARDMAERLGTKGHIAALRRTRVGPFGEDAMISLDNLERLRHIDARHEALTQLLLPVETALDDIPVLAVTDDEAARLKSGQAVIVRGRDAPQAQGIVLVSARDCPVALAELSKGVLQPKRVFNLPARRAD